MSEKEYRSNAVEHKRDWSDWQPGDDGRSCSCGFNGTFEECAENRALESEDL